MRGLSFASSANRINKYNTQWVLPRAGTTSKHKWSQNSWFGKQSIQPISLCTEMGTQAPEPCSREVRKQGKGDLKQEGAEKYRTYSKGL